AAAKRKQLFSSRNSPTITSRRSLPAGIGTTRPPRSFARPLYPSIRNLQFAVADFQFPASLTAVPMPCIIGAANQRTEPRFVRKHGPPPLPFALCPLRERSEHAPRLSSAAICRDTPAEISCETTRFASLFPSTLRSGA